jgi:hypothetical protein
MGKRAVAKDCKEKRAALLASLVMPTGSGDDKNAVLALSNAQFGVFYTG